MWAFLHGFGSDRKGAKATAFRAAAQAEGATFVAIDFRGHGESPGSMADLTLSRMLEDVDALASEVAPRGTRLVLVGSSLGGLAAAWWASRNPERVAAAVLVAPAFGFLPRFLAEIGPVAAAAWEKGGVLAYQNEWMDVPLRFGLVTDGRAYDEAGLSAAYRTDTLILHGLRDERVPWPTSVEFVSRCPHRPSDVVLLGDGDHRMQGRVDDLARLAREFASSRWPRR